MNTKVIEQIKFENNYYSRDITEDYFCDIWETTTSYRNVTAETSLRSNTAEVTFTVIRDIEDSLISMNFLTKKVYFDLNESEDKEEYNTIISKYILNN